MSTQEPNFDALRRLLALKRHEQPPPGFFDDFSHRVIVGIKTGERGEAPGLLNRIASEAPWLQNIILALIGSPRVAGTLTVGVCGLLVAGVIYSNSPAAAGPQEGFGGFQADAAPGLQVANQSSGFVSSTNGVMPGGPVGPSLFDEFHDNQFQPAPVLVKAQAQ